MLKQGDRAPSFSLPSDNADQPLTLESFTGQRLLLFFYPKDSTAG